jgi:nitrate reductase gamma subunit
MAFPGIPLPQVSQGNVFWLPERRERVRRASLFGDLVIILFLCAQVLDGAFTYIGLGMFGHHIEANPLLAWLIAAIGPAGALASAKAAAIVAGGFLHLLDVHVAVATLTGMYLILAIAPWTHLLFFF